MEIFKAGELLKIAVQIEKNGFDFFNKVKNKAKSLASQETFDYLAKQEMGHQKIFEDLLSKSIDYQPSESYPGEYAQYLEALAGENIFTDDDKIKDIVKNVNSDVEAIQIGIGFEKDSIIFYNDMKKFIPQSDQEIVDKIIEEEKAHLTKLLGIEKSLKS
jgi:rubrerythrin